MNRSFFNVILGGFGATEQSLSKDNEKKNLLRVVTLRMRLS